MVLLIYYDFAVYLSWMLTSIEMYARWNSSGEFAKIDHITSTNGANDVTVACNK
jgi:hypothetical protein